MDWESPSLGEMQAFARIPEWLRAILRRFDYEFNPLSVASRAARARAARHLAEALRIYASGGNREQLLGCLRQEVPDWSARPKLEELAEELLGLKGLVEGPTFDRYVTRTAKESLIQQIAAALDEIWEIAERASMAGTFVSYVPEPEAWRRVTEGLDRTIERLPEIQAGLAELPISGERGVRKLHRTIGILAAMMRAARV